MEPIYEIYEAPFNGEKCIKKTTDKEIFYIPIDESNSDYQRYLAWLNGEEKGDLIS